MEVPPSFSVERTCIASKSGVLVAAQTSASVGNVPNHEGPKVTEMVLRINKQTEATI